MPIMVARDMNHGNVGTGMLFARVVPAKGVQPYAVKSLSADIASLGYSEFVFKSDNEPSVVALKEVVKLERHERIVMEAAPVHESKSNGAIENAVQLVQGQSRSMKDCLESRLGSKMSCDSSLIPWLVLHASRTINRHHVGQDGQIAYPRW